MAAAAPLAWGARVSPAFRAKVRDLVKPFGGATADDLMVCMAWESGRTFRADVTNMAGSGATGLIQFMPETALEYFYSAAQIAGMGPTVRKANGMAACKRLAAMTPEEQLDYVARYFRRYAGRLRDLSDLYMAILWPAAIGKPADYVLFDQADAKHPARYRQNAGLDANRDGKVTKAETVRKVEALRAEGLKPANRA